MNGNSWNGFARAQTGSSLACAVGLTRHGKQALILGVSACRERKSLSLRMSLRSGAAWSSALRITGYEVSKAADGAVGLIAATQPNIDLVLLDLLLPRRDGLEVLCEMRDHIRPGLLSS